MTSPSPGTTSSSSGPASIAGLRNERDTVSAESHDSQDVDTAENDDSVLSSARDAVADLASFRVTSGLAKLMFGSSIEKIGIETVRSSNSKASTLQRLVVVIVGGTGGIGKLTALELFRRTTAPKLYIVGRNAEKGNDIVRELMNNNPHGEAFFIQKDISRLKNVDAVCEELKQREEKVNCLMLTAGSLSVQGRTETDEGIDEKMATNYYARMKLAVNLMPLLTAAADAGELSRVLTVLAAGSEGNIHKDDLDLKHHFSLHLCMAHCVVMTDFMMEQLAKKYPSTSFSHSYPGSPKTGIANELTGPVRLATKVLYAILSPWIINVQESGERHLFQMTSQCYPAATAAPVGIEVPQGLQVMRGLDGQVGSGAYLLDWDGKPTGDEQLVEKYKAMSLGPTVWEHTMQIFEQAERLGGGRGEKRGANTSPESSSRTTTKRVETYPVGWRAA